MSKKDMKPQGLYTEQHITDTLEKNYMPYAMSVIVSRAIPEIDGFKPSHRKLLYTMYKMGLLGNARTKSSNVVGQTMKLNPHGDMAIYETMVRLTRGNDSLLHPFVDSKGNFGKVYSRDMMFAAPRYTEVRLDKICNELFKDIDKNTVDFVDNYDGSTKEPVLLPTAFPNVLVNPNQGIAVGMASTICSFNLTEVCDATIQLLKNGDVNLMEYLKAPDFSTGGELILVPKEMEDIYRTGRGSFKVRSRYRYDKANSCIEIYEIPYSTTSEAIIDAIIELVKEGKIRDINDVRDETDLGGLKITIDIKKSANPDQLMARLYKLTPLMDSFSCNFNVLIDGRPRVMGVQGLLDEWINFRIGCIRRQTLFDMQKKTEKLHLLEGLAKILLDIDKAIRIIRHTEKEAQVVPNLMDGFGIDQIQAEFVAEIKLRNLNREYLLNRTSEIETLKGEISELGAISRSDERICKIIIKQLQEISKKYGQPRRTIIVHENDIEDEGEHHLIEDYNVKLFLTRGNYFKKIQLVSLRSNPEHKLKEDDSIVQELDARNKSEVLFFSDKFTVYKMKIYELDDCKASSLGEYLVNLLGMAPDEKIIYMTVTDDYQGYMFFMYQNGKATKVDFSAYATKTNRKKLANAYSDASPLACIAHIRADVEYAAISSIEKVLVFNTASINAKSTRDAQGVQVMNSKKGSIVSRVLQLEQAGLSDPDYYRTQNIPATGCFLRDQDKPDTQMRIDFV